MVTTRRANGIQKPSEKASSPQSPISRASATTELPTSPTTIPPPTHNPHLPTSTERLLLALYPLTLLLGSLFSSLSPSIHPPNNTSTYSTLHQSFQPAASAPSYFAQKRNIFNVYFVKIGWFWCSVAFWAFVAGVSRGRGAQRHRYAASAERTSGSEGGPPTTRSLQWNKEAGLQWRQERDAIDARLRRIYQAAFRYLIATAFWVLTTQWFFGPPLVDRGFALTGGVCNIAEQELEAAGEDRKTAVASVLTHAACRAVGGRWAGGYDISGHVFILILGSGMLWMEMLPFLFPEMKGFGIGRVVRSWNGKDVRVADELGAVGAELYRSPSLDVDRQQEPVKWTLKTYATTSALGVAGLSWWMLLMTAAFFHEWVEKVSACLLAFAGLWAVYFLPRALPAFRSVVGMPGV